MRDHGWPAWPVDGPPLARGRAGLAGQRARERSELAGYSPCTMTHTTRCLLVISLLAGTACDPGTDDQPAIDDVVHPEPDAFRSAPESCDALTLARYDELVATLDAAIELAETDVANHGVDGAYAAAPVYALQSFEDARDQAVAYRDYFLSWPVLYPGVAYNLRFRDVQESMWYAGHWANVSAVYHASEEARQAHALTEDVVEQANSLRADAGRCYMDWAFATASP